MTPEQKKKNQLEPREVLVKDLPLHAQVAWLMNQVEKLQIRVDALERQGRKHDSELMWHRPIGGPLR